MIFSALIACSFTVLLLLLFDAHCTCLFVILFKQIVFIYVYNFSVFLSERRSLRENNELFSVHNCFRAEINVLTEARRLLVVSCPS